MEILDLYCKAGGAGAGLSMDGTNNITGIDKEPQPRYPYKFIRCDALEFLEKHGHEFDYIHASPPCQRDSVMTKGLWKDRIPNHPALIAPTRELLIKTGKPYDIENVPGAPLINPIILCGSMFGLGVRRHRLFETSFPILQPSCQHKEQGRVVGVYGHAGGSSKRDGIKFPGVDAWKTAMEIDWMVVDELAEAIPPAYTRYIFEQFLLYGYNIHGGPNG